MTTRVLLLRHAESAVPQVFHGAESDIGLSERGRRQAEAIAQVLAATEPAVVVSSGMRRALDTARPIAAACRAFLRVESQFHERRVGSLSGTPFQAKEGVWPETLQRWMAGDTAFAPPGAESFDAIRERVLPVWDRLCGEYADKSFIVVAHGVVCKVLLLNLLKGLGPGDWQRLGPIRNVALTELVRDGDGWEAVRWNELPGSVVEI